MISRKILNISINNFRCLSVLKVQGEHKEQFKIKSWQVHSYGDINDLQLTTTREPIIRSPNELLIKVDAASVNPIDLLMLGGYGQTLFQIPRKFEMELPLTLGRDFCGTVLNKGLKVNDEFEIGDKVYGFILIHKQGSFAEIIVADKAYLLKQPEHLNAVESSSLVYTTMTAWSALYVMGGLKCGGTKKKILILGGSGGVGTSAIQLLKSQGHSVYATCSTDAVPIVESLGTDRTFDYKDKDFLDTVSKECSYDIVLDCAKFGYFNVPQTWKFESYLLLNSPLLINTDKFGLIGGLAASAGDLLGVNMQAFQQRKIVKWAFFTPSTEGFRFIDNLIKNKQIRPVVHKEFNFKDLPEAFKFASNGHLRGKVVIKF